ncbi:penicillin acylase family protein [Paracoccus sp. S-4012]|uniref:penicillin acylase family protein n=1 Tax=Paracoccus sp. S-4012 TaxID=2665648 RepID=UPI0012B03FDB|nr:penicillin acylase family protein [Paracoccus sp. S-4012]MRX50214.1 penicillin acylase family protein [Paracoccus sp. S-4012]
MNPDGTLEVAGLQHDAVIRVDRWGIPHIEAASTRDAWFLQGFNAARDRLWQIDLWRKRGLGLLAGDFGPGYLMQDRASRLLLYRGDMAPEWASYGADAEAICTAFAEGINAAIDLVEAGRMPLPAEFSRFGTRPARWAPEDVVRIRSHALSRNALSEFTRMRAHRAGAGDVDLLRKLLRPAVPEAEFDLIPDLDLPENAMDAYRLATCPVSFDPERLKATLAEAGRWGRVDVESGLVVAEGSNNWAVAGNRTESGRPLMASDPHRAYGTPSLRYLVHLEAPGLSLIGGGEPSSPGIMAGHNGTAAFSLTIFPADQEDLMVLQTEGTQFRHGDGWREMRVVEEVVPCAGHPDQTVELRFGGEAPVLWQGRGVALALRTVMTEPGTAPYMAALATSRTTSPEAFREALMGWGAPTVNMVYADAEGRIAWQPAGFVPRRTGWRGVVPVAGDGRFEWEGFMTAADLPGETDPARGFVHSANQFNLPEGWDHDARPVSFEWYNDGRAARVAGVLGEGPTSVEKSCALQTDTFSDLARRLTGCLAEDGSAAVAMLRGWNFRLDADSAAALLFETWLSRSLRPALMECAPRALRAEFDMGDIGAVLALFENRAPRLGAACGLDSPQAQALLLNRTLAIAWEELRVSHGDPEDWTWGEAHRIRFRPASDLTDGGEALPVGGSGTTVMLTDYDPPDFTPRFGASMRMVVDVGAWDESRWINTPGQSGDMTSPHARDLAAIWAKGEYVPMVYTREAVEAATEVVLTLKPGRG